MEFMTTAEAAALLNCDRTHLRRLARQGKIAEQRHSDRVVLYDRADVERYAAERRRGRPRTPPAEEVGDGG
jgi:excisionase family DNA binding protein